MKQVLQSLKTGAVTVADVPAPARPDNGLLVRAIASLVSAGTERMVVEFAEKNLWQKARARPDLARQVLQRLRREGLSATFQTVTRNLAQPMPLGYSLVGEVVDVGPQTSGVSVGDLVACAGAAIANHAEFVAVPERLFAKLPAGFSAKTPVAHAAFTTLGAIALHGFRLARPQLGERVAVVGLGLLGQLAVQIARAAGCRVFGVDLDPARVALAESQGADRAVLREAAEAEGQAFSEGRGFDVVLLAADAKSNDPVELAAALARDRARVVAIGAFDLTLPRKGYFAKELHFQVSRSYGPGRYDPAYELHGVDYPIGYVRWTEERNLEAFVHLLSTGAIDVERLITHRFDIASAPRAYDVITGKANERFLGVLLTYPEGVEPRSRIDIAPARPAAAAPATSTGVSLVGAGLFATATLLPALKGASGVALRGVVSEKGLSARTVADSAGFAFCSSRLEDVLEDAGTDAVFLLTRHHLHAPQVVRALAAGKHVFVEKPLCLTREELRAIDAARAGRPDRVLMVGFNRRFAPLAVRLHDFVRAGEPLVITYRINAGYLPPEHWTQDPAQGGGRLLGEACHFIDFAAWLAGEAPGEVVARAMADVGRYRRDNLVITMTFPSGSIASIVYVANGDKHAGKERVEVFSGGRIGILDDFRRLELHEDGRVRRETARGAVDKGHAAECAAFIQAVQGRAESPIPYAAIVATMEATFAAQDSLAGGDTGPQTIGDAPASGLEP
jgi:predicted dehydrogenase/threonine dehydrogenase-like Zn-dependent dehydrogenase